MEPYIGQIQPYAFGFTPRGWAFCDGQLLSIATNTALFSLMGTTYGGNGQTTFALPDLRGRSIVHPGTGPGLSNITWGEVGGTEAMTLTQGNMPMHAHALVDGMANVTTVVSTTNNGNNANVTDNGANGLGTGGSMPEIFRESPTAGADSMAGVHSSISGSTSIAGGSQPFGIRNPFVGIYMSIALVGIFPSRD